MQVHTKMEGGKVERAQNLPKSPTFCETTNFSGGPPCKTLYDFCHMFRAGGESNALQVMTLKHFFFVGSLEKIEFPKLRAYVRTCLTCL